MRLELAREGLLFEFANHYTTDEPLDGLGIK